MSTEPAPPPSPQEIHRKLSVHAPPPLSIPARSPSKRLSHPSARSLSASQITYPAAFSSESDSDTSAMQSPVTATHHAIPSFSEGHGLEPIEEGARRQDDASESEDDAVEASEGEVDEGALREEAVIKTGYLYKKGERRKTWKKRWFVLRPTKLAYYKSSAEYRLLYLTPTPSISSVQPVQLKKYDNALAIITPSRTFYLRAETAAEAQSWVKSLREVVKDAKEEEEEELENALNQSMPRNPLPPPPGGSVSSGFSPPQGAASSDSDDHGISVTRQRAGSLLNSPPPVRRAGSAFSSTPSLSLSVDRMARSQSMSMSPTLASMQPREKRDPNKPILQGYMTKMGKRKGPWRKRWFVLRETGLEYGKSHMDTRVHRTIPISSILHAIEYAPPDAKHHHHLPLPHSSPPQATSPSIGFGIDTLGLPEDAHVFKVITPERAFVLCAPSEEEEIRWLSALRALIERSRGPAQGAKGA